MSIDVKEQKREYMTLKIPKPKNLERIFYILVIIGLLFMLLVYNPFPQFTCNNCQVSELGNDLTAAAVEDSTEEVVETQAAAEETTVVPEVVEEVVPEPEPVVVPVVEEGPKMTALEGEIKYTIVSIDSVIKNAGTDSEYGKVTTVTYKIENNKEIMENVHIKVYAYDSKSSDIQDLERADVSFDIGKGEVRESTIKLKSGSFKNLDLEKTVKLKFFEVNKWLKTIEKTHLIK